MVEAELHGTSELAACIPGGWAEKTVSTVQLLNKRKLTKDKKGAPL